MTLEVPEVVTLADGRTAVVKGVAASVLEGRLERVTYTVEKQNGGWADVAGADGADGPLPDLAAADAPGGR